MARIKGDYALLSQATNGQWYFEHRAANHKTRTDSELYTRRASAIKAAQKLGLPVYEVGAQHLELVA